VQQELYLLEDQSGQETPYERLLGDAMMSDGALFTREDAVEAAWAIVDRILVDRDSVLPYERQTWGPKDADALLASGARWRNPTDAQEPR
jgi:glucose-6-phosphate 1-dehydrogenase